MKVCGDELEESLVGRNCDGPLTVGDVFTVEPEGFRATVSSYIGNSGFKGFPPVWLTMNYDVDVGTPHGGC